jgi:hypothetical protein
MPLNASTPLSDTPLNTPDGAVTSGSARTVTPSNTNRIVRALAAGFMIHLAARGERTKKRGT